MVVNTRTILPRAAVIDASVILTRIFPDEKYTPQLAVYFKRFTQGRLKLIAPGLLKYEVANALRSGVVQRRMIPEIAGKLLEEFLKLPINYLDIDFTKVLATALKYKISVYDAAYVCLAKTKRLPLLSLDRKLAKVAR